MTRPRPPLHPVSDADRALYRTPELESALSSTRTEAQARAESAAKMRAKLQADNRSFTVRSLVKLFGGGNG